MDIDLTPEQQEFIAEAIKSGRFKSAQEAVDEGLRLLKKREEEWAETLRRLNADIEVGVAELDAGLGIDGETVFEELRARSRARRNGRV